MRTRKILQSFTYRGLKVEITKGKPTLLGLETNDIFVDGQFKGWCAISIHNPADWAKRLIQRSQHQTT